MVRLNTERTIYWEVEADFDELQHLHETYAELHTNYDLDENHELYTYAQSVLQKMQENIESEEASNLSTAEYHILRTMIAWYLEEFEGLDEQRDEFLHVFDERLRNASSDVAMRQ